MPSPKSSQARLLPCLGLERVGVERHRQNRLLTASRRAAMVSWRSSGETAACRRWQRRPDVGEREHPGRRHRRRLGADAAQDHRARAVPGRVEPVGDARVVVRDDGPHDPVVVDHGLVPVEAALVPGVVDGLPPRVAQRVAPVEALRRRDLDQERLVGCRAPRIRSRAGSPPRRPWPCRRAEGGTCWAPRAGRTAGRSRGWRRRSPPARPAGARSPPAGLRPGAAVRALPRPIRSMCSEEATSVSQS